MIGSQLDDLASRFIAGTIPRDEWTHATHLAVGAWLVHKYGPDEAIKRLRVGIRALNDRHGTPNTDKAGYHETITIAYVRLLDQALAGGPRGDSIESRLQVLVRGPLAERAVLSRFWSHHVLMSSAARAAWMPPDLEPLELPITTTVE